jgi:hypothetical protein
MDTFTTFDFRIDAWTPDTLPMVRLAEYVTCLAKLMGSEAHVHLLKVRKGSAVPEIAIDLTAEPKVRQRLSLVNTADAPDDIKSNWNKVNALLREDNAYAVLRVKHGATILEFPGRKTPLSEEVVVHEQGELDGVVIRVGGKDSTVPVWLQGEGGEKLECNATREIAKQLAQHLFEDPVRVAGNAKWRRTRERVWELAGFDIKSFELLDQTPLNELVTKLRAIDTEWSSMEDPQAELRRLRGS